MKNSLQLDWTKARDCPYFTRASVDRSNTFVITHEMDRNKNYYRSNSVPLIGFTALHRIELLHLDPHPNKQ